MLSTNQWESINSLVGDLNSEQRLWLSGYLVGLDNTPLALPPIVTAATANEATTATPITIVYGSQGGNGKQIATAMAQLLTNVAVDNRVVSLADYKTAWLKKERFLFIVVSTHGEGEPPDDTKVFYDFIFSSRAPALAKLKYATLALGDSSYEFFCKIGQDIHERLEQLGAQALQSVVECDTDYEQSATKWQQNITDMMKQEEPKHNGSNGSNGVLLLPTTANTITLPVVAIDNTPTRAQPFTAPIIEHIMLTTPPRRTLHIELALEDANIDYRPGDAIGIFPQNPPATADKVATTLGLTAQQTLTIDEETANVSEWMIKRLDISRPTAHALNRYQKIINSTKLGKLLDDKKALGKYINGRDYGDVFCDFPPLPEQQSQALSCLRRLAPRLYSLASSRALRDDEAHLLVAVSDYNGHDTAIRNGVCSQYLATQQAGDTVDIYLQRNDNFRLPTDGNTPIIMIGPGTGIAPFRAFMEEREAAGDAGANWLFFGNRHRRDEFYYQTEWQGYGKNGLLTRLDVAFSRDGTQKIYVQDRLQQHGGDIWQWLQDDAHIYVCGDTNMASDVHERLSAIIGEHHGGDSNTYLQQMQTDGRYQRDIY